VRREASWSGWKNYYVRITLETEGPVSIFIVWGRWKNAVKPLQVCMQTLQVESYFRKGLTARIIISPQNSTMFWQTYLRLGRALLAAQLVNWTVIQKQRIHSSLRKSSQLETRKHRLKRPPPSPTTQTLLTYG